MNSPLPSSPSSPLVEGQASLTYLTSDDGGSAVAAQKAKHWYVCLICGDTIELAKAKECTCQPDSHDPHLMHYAGKGVRGGENAMTLGMAVRRSIDARRTNKYTDTMNFDEFVDWATHEVHGNLLEGKLRGGVHFVLGQALNNKVFGKRAPK